MWSFWLRNQSLNNEKVFDMSINFTADIEMRTEFRLQFRVNCGRIPPKCLQLTHLISMSHSTKTTLVEQASLGHHHAHSLFHCNSISVLWKLPERKLLFVWHSFGSNLVSPAHFVIQLMPRHLPRHVGKAICPRCQNYFNYISNRFQYKIT